MASKRLSYVADFETTTDPNDCRVWGWGLARVDQTETLSDVQIGTDMVSFLDEIMDLSPAIVYFHNLKFDGHFIVDYLMRNGYRLDRSGGKKLFPYEFQTLISGMGEWYTVTVCWGDGSRVEFRDSYKKLPMPVRTLAKAFKLPVEKGELDYKAPRPVGHRITKDEAHYIRLDVFIVARALNLQLVQGMTKLTVGSDALAEFKALTGTKMFQRSFPVLPESMDAEIRQAYRGGFTYADKRFTGTKSRSGLVYDVNSLYPSVMRNCVLPYGEPEFFEGIPSPTSEYPLYIVSVTFTAKLKKNHIPCIQVKGSHRFTPTDYQKVISEPVTMMCTNVDLALWQDHYDMDILTYNGGWKFRPTYGIFNEYIDKWMEVKKTSEGGLRELAKLFLNSLYGKFASNPDVTGKYPVMEDNIVKLKLGEHEVKDPVYTAMGVFITAYAREVTIRAAQDNYDVFAYADTDSLHLLTDEQPKNLDVHKNRLGAWKFEYAFTSAMYIRAKQYLEHVGPGHCRLGDPESKDFDADHICRPSCEYETHIAGLDRDIAEELTFDDVLVTRTFDGKLTSHRVPGGIVLVEGPFTLSIEP